MTRKLIKLHGTERTIAEWAKIYGKSPLVIYNRLRNNWDLLEALTTPTDRRARLVVNGEARTVHGWAKVARIKPSTIYGRRQRGWPEQSLILPRQAPEPLLMTAFGRTQSLKAWAKEYGVNYTTVYDRITRAKMPLEAALTIPVDQSRKAKAK